LWPRLKVSAKAPGAEKRRTLSTALMMGILVGPPTRALADLDLWHCHDLVLIK
jgi:hypothetical protein